MEKTERLQHHTGNKGDLRSPDYLPALFLVVAFIFFHKGYGSEGLRSLAIIFVSIVLEAIPFMLAGSLIGGLIEAFISRERMTAILPKRGWVTVFIAAGAGIVFPVCECAVVPVVRRLLGKGLPFSAAIAYLLGGPIVNPIVFASTALAYNFDWPVVCLRLIFGYIIAVAIGLIMGRFFTGDTALKECSHEDSGCMCHCDSHDPHAAHSNHAGEIKVLEGIVHHNRVILPAIDNNPQDAIKNRGVTNKLASALSHGMDDFFNVGHYLVIGAFIAALANTYLTRSSFIELSGASFFSVIMMVILAVLLNLCSEADAFISASFRGIVQVHAQMAFMLTGPIFDLKLLLMYKSVFKPKAIVALVMLIIMAVLLISWAYEAMSGVIL